MCPNIVYDDIAPAYARHRQAQAFVVETLRRLHALSPGGPILELGCGTGAFITALAKSGSRTHFAMDPSRRMLARAPRRARVRPPKNLA